MRRGLTVSSTLRRSYCGDAGRHDNMDSGSFIPTSRDKSKSRAALPIYPAPLSIEFQDSTPTQILFKQVGGTYEEYHAHLAHVKSPIQTFTLN